MGNMVVVGVEERAGSSVSVSDPSGGGGVCEGEGASEMRMSSAVEGAASSCFGASTIATGVEPGMGIAEGDSTSAASNPQVVHL